jgi:GDP-L-fucose synthase
VASGTVHRISDLVDVLSRRFPGVKVKWDATKPLGQLTRSYDIGRLTALGFSSQVDLMTGINTTVDWYIQNQQQPNPTSESHAQ